MCTRRIMVYSLFILRARGVGPMLVQCWPAVYDVGPTFIQRCVGASYSLGMCINVKLYTAFIIIIIIFIILILILLLIIIFIIIHIQYISKVASTKATYGFRRGLLIIAMLIIKICKCFYLIK